MNEKLKKRLVGGLLLIGGALFLFFGARGAIGLLENGQQGDQRIYEGSEVPRDMIESAYQSGPSAEAVDEPAGDVFVLPVLATPVKTLPALPTVNPTALDITVQPTPEIDNSFEEEAAASQVVEPRWIYVKEIGLNAPIIPAESGVVEVEEGGETHKLVQWEAPNEKAAGWHTDSAPLGEVGNTVINGHHNVHGKVFGQLVYLQEGDLIQIFGSDGQWYYYAVANKMVVPETGVSLAKRIENAAWLLPSDDERLTLITCWPETTNSHRLILVASPVEVEEVAPGTTSTPAAP
jgi:LPXTG-site transpeptidase (sortase) family protein